MPEQPLLPTMQPRETRRVIRSARIEINSYHSRIALFDQRGANVGTLTMLTEDLVEFIWLIQPQRIFAAGQSLLGESWNLPPDCTVHPLMEKL